MKLILADCREALATLEDCIVDALVTDPPAGISFMGRDWDKDKGGRDAWIEWLTDIMQKCKRTMKPGAHAFVWAIPRTSHWTATAIENAGFEIRDVIDHIFGSGFPKSLNLGDGIGTALKPAHENWILARKPLEGTVSKNVLKHGTGGLNIDKCRVGTDKVTINTWDDGAKPFGGGAGHEYTGRESTGRWPPNVLFSHKETCKKQCKGGCPIKELDRQSGELITGGGVKANKETCGLYGIASNVETDFDRDSGGASRFFPCFRYEAKASRAERDAGCEHLPLKSGGELTDRQEGSAGLDSPRAGAGRTSGGRNVHPTCKPVDLMRWLIRLVCPKDGTCLDPFMGSGTTGIAAHMESCKFIGIEKDPDYFKIAEARINEATKQGRLF
jgi:site-specific DNA-methyltransferase (adenine-specific)